MKTALYAIGLGTTIGAMVFIIHCVVEAIKGREYGMIWRAIPMFLVCLACIVGLIYCLVKGI